MYKEYKPNMAPFKNPMPSQDPKVRAHNFKEVAEGYTEEMAIDEAKRCLGCPTKPCVAHCPVNINIPDFKNYTDITKERIIDIFLKNKVDI